MKKLLSICFLSMLLVLAGFTAKAQTNCCFWLENLQPDTVQDVSNLGMPGTAALLPGHGNALVLNNTLNRVDNIPFHYGEQGQIVFDRTDWFRVHMSGNCANPDDLVSLEWILYKDGVAIPTEQLHNVADIYIYTKYDQIANNGVVDASCGHMKWLGGRVYKPGVCENVDNNCDGGYPGAFADVDNTHPYGFNSYISASYTPISYYHFDAFRYSFFSQATTLMAITWKEFGNYSLVVRLRQRTQGGSGVGEGFQNIGSNGTCCDRVLATDSLSYLTNTTSEHAVCEGETYTYGRPAADYTEQGVYKVLFGTETCEHWEVDSIVTFSFYTRTNPNIVANDMIVCKKEVISDEAFAALAPAVNTDAPGYLSNKIYWSAQRANGTWSDWSETLPARPTNTPGVYHFKVYQSNYYDAVTGQDFHCDGNVAEFTITVKDVLPPVLDCEPNHALCFSDVHDLTIKAKLNPDDNGCADQIHWFRGTAATGTPVATTASYLVNVPNTDNADKEIVFTAFAYDESTETYSTTGVSVTINVWKNPELVANNQNDSIVKCPHTTGIELKSNFKSTNFTGTHASELTWDYVWTKNGVNMNTNTADVNVTAPGCDEQDVYVVTATATSIHGCSETIIRRITVNGEDHATPSIAWRNNATATMTLHGCDTANLFAGSWSAPYTITDAVEGNVSTSAIKIAEDYCHNASKVVYTVDVNATAAPCTTIVTRSYTLVDECGNQSAPISQVVTIINNKTPEIVGRPVEMLPVRPLHNNCKCNLPDRDALLAAFHADFTVTTGCQANVVDANIKFFMGNTTTVANGNQDIFANTDQVTVYAQVTDECGNISAKTPVFILNKPAAIDIAHGAISSPVYELCNTETAHVVFDSVMIHNGLSPYVFTWSQTPVPEKCGMTVAENKVEIDVWALNGGAYNTSAQFIMTVEDAYGCVTTDTSNAIRWFGIPDVTIIEAFNNDDYPHTAPVVVCPTFGHYLLKANAQSNIPENPELSYTWTGESIHFSSNVDTSFIAVNENICKRDYTNSVEVTNAKGCKATASYTITANDTEAPVITLDMPTDTITNLDSCKIIVPDYTALFTPATVSDDCWTMDSIQVTQNIAAGTKLTENTDVVITVAPKCGPTATYTIKACFPEPRISTEILASVDRSCYPYTTIFTANTANFVAPLATYWDGATTSAASKEFTTSAENGNTLTHTVRVVDANGCEATDSYTLVVYHTPVAADVNVTSTPNHYCDAAHTDGTFTVTSNNPEVVGVRVHGTTEWFAFPYTATVNDGTYYFDLRTIHDCVAENIKNVTVAHDTVDANLVPALIVITDNANCTAPWSGTIEVTNPVVGYQYHVSAGLENSGDETVTYNPAMLGAVRFNFLYQGMYTVDVLSTFNCHASASIEIEDHRHIPEIPTSDVTANTNCINPNGVITLNNTNSDYWYTIGSSEIRGNGGIITFDGLSSDYYLLTVANKYTRCSDAVTIFVPDSSNAPKLPTVTVNDNTFCVGSNGSIVLSDLNTAYQYTLKDASDNVVSLNGLAAGNYTLYVYDPVTGCESNHTYTINDALVMPTFGATEIIVTVRTACDPALANGKIQINQVSGFSYSVLDELTNVIFDLTTLDSGNYVIVKTNIETQCLSTKHVHVGFEKPDLKLNLTATPDIDCSDEVGTGAITAALVPATTATYTVVNATTNEPAALTGLNPGDYIVTAFVPATGCSYVGNVTVGSNYTYPTLNVVTTANYMCNSVKNGTLTISDVQTVKNYTSLTYYIDGVATVNPRTDLNGGTYEVYAITNNHCQSTSVNAVVVDSAFVVRAFDVVANSVCNPTASKPGNGQIRVLYPQSDSCDYIFTDLTPTHHYDVDHFEPIDYTKYTLEDGWYLVQISDTRTGCVSSDSVYVPYQPINVTIDALTSTPDYICTPGTGNGTITVSATSASLASVLAYSIDGGLTYNLTGSFANVEDGEYHIVVMDTVTRCIYDALAGADITVEQGQYKIVVEYNNVANTACDPALYNGEVHATVSYADVTLGTGDFTVAIAGNSFTGLNGGDYALTITDNNTGCVYNETATVLNDNEYTPDVTITAYNRNQNPEDYHFCFGQNNAYLVADAVTTLAGDTNFSYLWWSSCDHLLDSTHARVDVYTQQNYCCTYKVKVTSLLTGCENTQTLKVCIDTLPVITFAPTGSSIHLVSQNPNQTYANCENKEFTMCIVDPGFQTIEWTNGYTGNEACFTIAANTLTPGSTSYCVRVVDFNGCASGPQAVNVETLPIATGKDTIMACNGYDFVGNKVADQNFNYTVEGPNTFTVVDTLNAVNGCDSIVTYTIILSTDPTLNDTLTVAASYCAGESIIAEGTGYEVSDAVVAGWRIVAADAVITNDNFNTAGVAFDPTAALTYDMNGKKIYAYAANGCDTLYARAHTLVVNDIPTLAVEDKTLAPDTICLGGAFEYETPAAADINWHGSVGTTKVQYSTDGTTWTDVTAPIVPTVAGNNYQIRFVADNDCTEDYIVLDGPVAMVVNDTVKLSATNVDQLICLGATIAPIVITNNFSVVSIENLPAGLSYDTTANSIIGNPTAAGTFNYTIKAESSCGCTPKEIRGTITVQDSIKLSLTNAEQTVCLGEPIETVEVSTANGSIMSTTDVTSYGLSVSDNSVSGTPTFIGTKTVIFTVYDPNHVCATKMDTVVITVNDTVKLDFVDATVANQTICLGSGIANIKFDYENATVEVSTLPTGLTFDETTNTISGAPLAADTINYTITATSNNGCTDYDKTIVGKIIVNDTVKVAATNLEQAAFCLGGDMIDVVITAENAEVTVTGLPAGVAYDNTTMTISGSPVAADTVTYTITATSNATPSCGVKTLTGVLMISDTVTLTATNLDQTAICLGDPIVDVVISATNATVAVETLPAGVTFNNETNTISGTPESAGTFAYVIKATSVNGCTEKIINNTIVVNDTVKLTVTDELTLDQTVCKGTEIDTIFFTVANATLSIDGELPAGITFENGKVFGVPTTMNTTGYTFNVLATSNATPACDSKSIAVKITVNDAPAITTAISGGDLEVCVGQVFTTPTAPAATDILANGTAITSTKWFVDGAEMDWTAPSTLAQDGKTLYFVAENACGTDTVKATLTVHDLPVPEIVSDTIVCNDGVANLSATAGFASYQWYKNGEEITGANAATYAYTASEGEGTYTFTVEVVDANGCVSVANTNATVDTRTFSVDDAVTVVVTGKPHFIFTHNGVETHEFDANTADAQTNYTWMVSNPCEYNPDELVFVNFDIYFNGELIADDSIGLYITEDGTMTNRYVTRDSINWNAFSGTPMNTTCYYNYAQSNMTTGYYQSNHYPAGNYGFSGNTKYDDLYLHFLAERPVYKTVNKFRRAGEYKIVYTLIATSNSHPNGHEYNNGTTTPAVIGGYDAVVSSAVYTTLATDVITINVEGEDYMTPAPAAAPAPALAEVDGPTMTLYPNPATAANTVKAHIKGIAGDTKVQVVNIAGKVLAEDAVTIPAAADYVYSREINNLAPGIYFIYVKGENATISRKLVVTK